MVFCTAALTPHGPIPNDPDAETWLVKSKRLPTSLSAALRVSM
jgi:hypothetical protein